MNGKDVHSRSDKGRSEQKNKKYRSLRLVTRPDGLPLSYRRLVGSQGSVGSCEDMPWKCSCDKHPAYCWDWNDDEVVVCSRKNAAITPRPFSNKRSPSQFSHERQSPTGGKKYFSEMYFFFQHEKRDFVSSGEPF